MLNKKTVTSPSSQTPLTSPSTQETVNIMSSARKFVLKDAEMVIEEIGTKLARHGLKVNPKILTAELLLEGMNVELEHGRFNVRTHELLTLLDKDIAKHADQMTNVTDDNRWKTAMIALAHLFEGRWYYPRLEEYVEKPMEKMLEEEGKTFETLFIPTGEPAICRDLYSADW